VSEVAHSEVTTAQIDSSGVKLPFSFFFLFFDTIYVY